MKRLGILICFILSSCFSATNHVIFWPEKIWVLEGEGDIEVSWREFSYEGPVTLKIEYPERILMLFYGPFGETAAYLKRDEGAFSFFSSEGVITDEKRFEERIGISIKELIEAIMDGKMGRNIKVVKKDKDLYIKGEDGEIKIRFSELMLKPSS